MFNYLFSNLIEFGMIWTLGNIGKKNEYEVFDEIQEVVRKYYNWHIKTEKVHFVIRFERIIEQQ